MPSNRFTKGRLTTALQEVYRADRESVVTSIFIANTDTSARTYEIQHVPADEATSDDHCLFHDVSIRASTTTIIETPIFLAAGDAIFAKASTASKVAVSLYVLDYSSFLSSREF